jgi:hypothetical protein
MLSSAKVAPAPTAKSKSTKHVSFADPVASVLGDAPVAECEKHSPVKDIQADLLMRSGPLPLFADPMLDEFLIAGFEGPMGAKPADSINSKTGIRPGQYAMTGESKLPSDGFDHTTTQPVSNPNSDLLQLEVRSMADTQIQLCDTCIPTVDINLDVHSTPLTQPVDTESSPRGFSMNFAPDAVMSIQLHPQLGTEPHIHSVPELGSESSQQNTQEQVPQTENIAQETTQTTMNQSQSAGQGTQSSDAPVLDPVDVFLQSISNPVDQPLLPEPQPADNVIPNDEEHIPPTDTQRKSTRLAKKAQTRVGKHTMEIAQELLTKKLGHLSQSTPSSSKINFESFSQHLDNPLNMTEMEAIQDLVEHGTKMEGKAGSTKLKGAARKMVAA